MIEWFYGKGGQQFGPIDEVTLSARIATGEIGPQDLVWNEGMDSWSLCKKFVTLLQVGMILKAKILTTKLPNLPSRRMPPPWRLKPLRSTMPP